MDAIKDTLAWSADEATKKRTIWDYKAVGTLVRYHYRLETAIHTHSPGLSSSKDESASESYREIGIDWIYSIPGRRNSNPSWIISYSWCLDLPGSYNKGINTSNKNFHDIRCMYRWLPCFILKLWTQLWNYCWFKDSKSYSSFVISRKTRPGQNNAAADALKGPRLTN
jgi:hypothetical protein